MKALRDAALIYAAIAAVLLAVFMGAYAADYAQNAAFVRAKAALPSTDLSHVTIDGQRPGMPVGELATGAFVIGADGAKYNHWSENAGGAVIASITGNIYWHKHTSTLEYGGRAIVAGNANPDTLNPAIIHALGENYMTYSIRHESMTPSTIFRDQERGLELRLYYYGAELSRADEPPDLPGYREPGGVGLPLAASVALPLFLALLLLPLGCCFRFRRKRVVIPALLGYALLAAACYGVIYWIGSTF